MRRSLSERHLRQSLACTPAGFLGLLLAGCLWTGGCQTYEPKPLDLADHQSAWETRLQRADDLATFARRVTADPTAPPEALDLADGVSLPEAEIVALAFNPGLRQARAGLGVSAARVDFAGLWDDPQFEIDVLRIIESVPDPWVIPLAVGFTIPLSGRLDVERTLAQAEHRAAVQRVLIQEWELVVALRVAWIEWSAALEQVALSREVVERMRATLEVVDRMEAVGQMSRMEARLLRLERGSREADRILLEARAGTLELQVRALMGLKPRAAIALQPTLRGHWLADGARNGASSAAEQSDPEALAANAPLLALRRAEYEAAEEQLHLEVRKQYPDLTIGPAFERDQDQSRVGFVLGIPIPVLNANRGPIAEALARREASRVAFEAEYERLVALAAEAEFALRNARAARRHVEETLVPLAEAQLADQMRLAELGQLSSLVALETVIRSQDTKVRLVDALLAESLAAARLAALAGPPEWLPPEAPSPSDASNSSASTNRQEVSP